MDILENEYFEEIINSNNYYVKEHGILSDEIYSFDIKRDTNNKLIFSAYSKSIHLNDKSDIPLGSVYTNKNIVKLAMKQKNDNEVTISGVNYPNQYIVTSENNTQKTERTEVSSIVTKLNNSKAFYMMEWILNLNHSFMFDCNKKTIVNHSEELSFNHILLKTKENQTGLSSCICLTINKNKIYIGNTNSNKEKNSGFIFYDSIIDENERDKIRYCLSFILGIPLIYLGFSTFSKEGHINGLKAISAYDFNGGFNIHSQPPTILSKDYSNLVNSEVVSNILNKIYENYDKYNLTHIFWIYWHARTSPIHISAGQYGAAIEFLQKIFLDINKSKIDTKLFKSKNEWHVFREDSIKILNKLNLGNEEIELLTNKINNINNLPHKIKLKRFLESLRTSFSKIEEESWNQRNNSAHGNTVKNDDYTKLIKETKVLMVLFHRLLFLITNSSTLYFDYYTLKHPLRKCTDSIVDN